MQHPQPRPPVSPDQPRDLSELFAHGVERFSEWLPRAVWRYRRELRPMIAALVLWSHMSLIIWLVGFLLGLSPYVFTGGAAVTLVAAGIAIPKVVQKHGRTGSQRLYIWACGIAAATWAVGAWTFGSFNVVMGAIDVTMGVAATIPWVVFLHRGTRNVTRGRVKLRVVNESGESRRTPPVSRGERPRTPHEVAQLKSEGNIIREHFAAACAQAKKLGPIKVMSIEHDEHGDGWTMRVQGPGLTVGRMSDRLADLESHLDDRHRARVGALQVFKEPSRASQVLVRYLPEDPLAKGTGLQLHDRSLSVMEPKEIGVWDDLTPIMLPLFQRHVLIGGMTGAGKSGLLNVLIYQLGMCEDVVLWGIDLKNGIELKPWRRRMHELATTPHEARQLLDRALVAMDRRGQMVSEMPSSVKAWPVTPRTPQLVVVIDEYSQLLLRCPEARDLVEQFVQVARAEGVQLIVATQKPLVEDVGSVLPAQCAIRIALHCATDRDGGVILGDGKISEGWRASRIGEKGYLLGWWPEHQLPTVGRALYLADKRVDEAVERTLVHRPEPDEASFRCDPAAWKEMPLDPVASAMVRGLDQAHPRALTNAELAGIAGCSPTSVSKYMGPLVASGEVEKVGARGGYRRGGSS